MSSGRIGIGILGCGNVARIHAEAIRQVPDLELVSVCSRSRDSAERLGLRYGIPAATSIEEFLGNKALGAVSICAPSGVHAELGCAAARAGKHVLVEKPIEIAIPKADALIDACNHAGVTLAVSFQSRHLDAPRLLKSAVENNRLGRLVLASAYIKWYRTPEYYASTPWRGTLKGDGGGALINQAIHTVDLLRWILGPVAGVSAFSGRLLHGGIEGEDTLVATLRFENGALGTIEAATSVYPGFRRRLEITGTEGTVILDGDNLSTWTLRDGSPNPSMSAGDVSNGSADPMAIDCEGHRRVMADFAEAIRHRRKPLVDGRDGRDSLELVEFIYRSAAQHSLHHQDTVTPGFKN
jgi:UDP-N-acetyl-2-amino-2-deoxyglucuronate dehydrogenase